MAVIATLVVEGRGEDEDERVRRQYTAGMVTHHQRTTRRQNPLHSRSPLVPPSIHPQCPLAVPELHGGRHGRQAKYQVGAHQPESKHASEQHSEHVSGQTVG